MPLTPGTRLGPYEITAQVGVGGMGEVYRATDTNLKRAVAIKVLPDSVASDAERLARFQREAEVLASLNHPHIAAIYGLQRTETATALVMELVEGPTLADRIVQGPIPIDEAVSLAKQITAAMEAAHDQGIIHRDLKPANIKVRPDGTVKVLDFGLAKALAPPGSLTSSAMQSPTITSPAAMTAGGVFLGTAAYMSPEQARGKAIDKRADIWSFGAVLYEMLTGARAFPGDDIADVLAAVLMRDPDWTLLPAGLSPVLRSYLKRCLQKDPKQRVRHIGDVSLALDGAFDDVAALPAMHSTAATPLLWKRALWVVATAIGAALVTGLVLWSGRSSELRAPTRFDYVLPEGQELETTTQRPLIAIAPDGRSFVYQTSGGLYRRSMEELEARLIPGTEESMSSPFFSPDGQWIAYFAATGQQKGPSGIRQLKKLAITGGPPLILCTTTAPLGASWAPDNTILFGQPAGIMRVSGNGGTPELIVRASAGEQMHGPQLLPDGRAVLFSVTTNLGPNRWDEAQIAAQELSSGKRTVLVANGSDARYLATGHLVYAVRDSLFAIAFDPQRLAVTGGAVPLVQGVRRSTGVNAVASNYGVSADGTLVYISGSTSLRSVVWINRDGTAAGSIASIRPGTYDDPRLSPDGSRLLATHDGDIWIYDIASGRSSRLTKDHASMMGVWDPTGAQVAYSSARKGNLEAWAEPSDGTGQPRQLTSLGGQVHVDTWSPDGHTLTIHHHPPEGAVRIFMLAMDRTDSKPELFPTGDFNAESADFSRDGHYVSYLSVETGQRELFIRPYKQPGGSVPVSVGGGREPVWADNGELFYRSPDGTKMFAVSVTTEPTLKVGPPIQVFQGRYYIAATGSPRAQYDVTPDGKRFLMLEPGRGTDVSADRPRVVVVQNWFEELKSKVPIK